MSIESIRTSHYRLPRDTWSTSSAKDQGMSIDAIDLITCHVTDSDGGVGLGYTYALSHGGEAIHALVADEFAPQLVGRQVTRPEPVWEELWQRSVRYGRGGVVSVALAAVDIALWDLCARRAGQPLFEFIGAYRRDVPVYGSAIDLGYSRDELLSVVAGWKDRGFGAVKIKVGRGLPEDLDRIAESRRVLGDDIELMVDANAGWKLPDAGRRLEAMRAFDLSWVEEPLSPTDVRGHAALQRSTGTAIAAGESLFSVAEFLRYMESDALRYVQADAGRVGGVTPWLRVAALAHAFELPMAPHFMQDLHVHLLCASPTAYRLEYLPLLDPFMERPLRVEAGTVSAPTIPGHGISFTSDIRPHLIASAVASRGAGA